MASASPLPGTSRCTVVAVLDARVGKADHELLDQTEHALKAIDDRWPDAWLETPSCSDNGTVVQAVLKSPELAFDFAVAINLAIWPRRFRFHATSTGHESARQQLGSHKLPFTINLIGLNKVDAQVIEATARLHATVMRDWKPSRAKAAVAMRLSANQNEAAARLNIRQQSVSEALRAGHAKELVACEDAIRERLGTLGS